MTRNATLKKRILEISFRHNLSHLSAVLTTIDILKDIYDKKKPEDIVVLSNGHAGLAQYVLLESLDKSIDAEKLLEVCGIHPDRLAVQELLGCNPEDNPIHCTTGSLGQGITVAVGYALSNPTRNVYCVISDGELNEGSTYEALRFMSTYGLDNLKVYVNVNGYSAYDKTSPSFIDDLMYQFTVGNIEIVRTTMIEYPQYLWGVKGHYHVLNASQYYEVLDLFK